MTKPFYKRIWVWVVGAILLLLLGAGLYTRNHLSSILESRIREALAKKPNRLYHIDFRKLKVEPLAGNVSIKDIEITPNQSVIDSMDSAGVHQSLIAQLHVKELDLKKIDMEKLINEQQVIIQQLLIEKPQIKLHFTGYKKEVSDTVDPRESIYHIASLLQEMSVHSIRLEKANVLISNPTKDTLALAENVTIELADFKIDTAQEIIPIDLNELSAEIGKFTLDGSPSNKIELNGFKASVKDSTLSVNSFHLIPKQTKEEFSSKLEYEKSWNDISTGKVEISGVDIDHFLFTNELYVDNISVDKLDLFLYKDKRPKWPGHLRHPIPSAAIKKIPVPINVKQVQVTNSLVQFHQKQPDHEDVGKLRLTKLNATITNITNIPEEIEANPLLVIDANTRMMGSGDMNAQIMFDLSSPKDSWTTKATIGKMNMAELNEILFPLTNVEIKDGKLLKVELLLNADQTYARGQLDMEYTDAKMNINTMSEQGDLEQRNLISLVANTVVRSKNIKGTPTYKVGHIEYTRTWDSPFFRFLWFATMEGLKDTFIGFKSKDEKEHSKDTRKENRKPLFKFNKKKKGS